MNCLKFLNSVNPLTEEAERALIEISFPVEIRKNKDLHPIGHTCRNIYFVVKGVLRIYYFKEATDITESFEFENSIVARADSVFKGTPSQKGIQAIEDSELVAIPSQKLFKLYDSYPDIERLFRLIFEMAYVDMVQRIESIQFHSAEERYLNLLSKSPRILQKVALKHIASYLGITRVSLSRIRAGI